ncbi:obg family GTPase CgtA [Halteromyces radiatus]|uniref:obg family GTPase CgtA n=1 Tax=Halteromyces radiatus TaxID=101107 RepID=UPI00221ECC89|nr:obg family GTPase CgtA [Halteromyces radiatus]KAI8086175.1 obg family GTPase CgtA [Halteromyces radiatus]
MLLATRHGGFNPFLRRSAISCLQYCRIHSTGVFWQDQEDIKKRRSVDYKLRGKGRQFVDFMRVVAKGGNGGDGCVSFHREKFLAKGPPNGGNGGRGGDVIIRANKDETTLRRLGKACTAKRGENGLGGGRHGTMGQHLVIDVPVGTIVRQVASPLEEEEELDEREKRDRRWVYYPRMDPDEQVIPGRKNFFLEADRMMDEEERYLQWRERKERQQGPIYADLAEHDQQVVVCHGGAGGYGNPHFLTTDNRSPKWATRGRPGEVRYLELELKTIADIGLVGLPNAGKSTLLGSISNAHPKQGSYAFTTLHPFVGTVDYADQYQLTVADIPGLIQGAHRNVGLGHAFLRHVERAKLLVYVVDLSGKAPWDDLRILQHELEAYRPGLTERQSLIVANKADQVTLAKDNLIKLQQSVEKDKIPVIPVSAKYEKNIIKLTSILRKNVEIIRKQEAEQRQRELDLQQENDTDSQ